MRIYNIEAINMGNDQQEIAEKVLELVENITFESEYAFDESYWITKACKELGWHSVPQTGGLEVEWN